jgi:hypothetical protein
MKAFWRNSRRAYQLNFGVKDLKRTNTYITLDTGASATVLGIKALFDSFVLTTDNALRIAEDIRESGVVPTYFSSASGDSMVTYPCVLHDAYIGNYHMDKFYFNLFVGGNISLALLGTDIIRFCDITKVSQNYIQLSNLDFKAYEDTFFSNIGNKEVFEINSLIRSYKLTDDAKLYASAFRTLYNNQNRRYSNE